MRIYSLTGSSETTFENNLHMDGGFITGSPHLYLRADQNVFITQSVLNISSLTTPEVALNGPGYGDLYYDVGSGSYKAYSSRNAYEEVILSGDSNYFNNLLSSSNTWIGTNNFNSLTSSNASFTSASIGYLRTITGSATIIGDQYIILNSEAPAQRFAGLKVYDSNSALTGSFEWDSIDDNWIQVETGGESAGMLTGISGSKGSEVYPTNNTLLKGTGNHTVQDSIITDDGTAISVAGSVALGGATVANGYMLEINSDSSGNIMRSTRGSSKFAMYQADNSDVYMGTTSNNRLRFLQNDGDALTIDTSKNVGIGTTSPSAKLEVIASAASGIRIKSATGDSNGFNIYTNVISGQDTAVLSNFYSGPMLFQTNNTERMSITSTGGVSFGNSGTAYGTAGQVLKSNGNAPPTWGAAGVNISVSIISSSTTAVKNTLYVLISDLTLTLPSTPADGDSIKISNLSGVTTCIIARNGSLIMGSATDLTLNKLNSGFEMIYSGASQGWILIGVEGTAA